MPAAPLPPDEDARLAALKHAHILDTDAERGFDDLVDLAALVCDTPISLVSLVDADRQWFKAKIGLDAQETPRDQAFCAYAILETETLIVPDATRDERFADNPLVTSEPAIRFYAGAPLSTSAGFRLGTLCVIDTVPREITATQTRALEVVARLAQDQLRLRERLGELEELLAEVTTLRGVLPVCAWCRKVRSDDGLWGAVEDYLDSLPDLTISHGICTDCVAGTREEMRGDPE